jgi:hypothetical protein
MWVPMYHLAGSQEDVSSSLDEMSSRLGQPLPHDQEL